MNKYEKALYEVLTFGELANDKSPRLLQELVDRATPMKPKVECKKDSIAEEYYDEYTCPNCGDTIYPNTCCMNNDCRQKIDWSDGDV